jgi:hypothetical protein
MQDNAITTALVDRAARLGTLQGLAAQVVALHDVVESDEEQAMVWPEQWARERLRRIVARLREQPAVLDEAIRYRESFVADLRHERAAQGRHR